MLVANPVRDTSDEYTRARSKVLRSVGFFALLQTAWVSAEASLEEGLALVRELRDELGESLLLRALALLARYRGDYVRARSLRYNHREPW